VDVKGEVTPKKILDSLDYIDTKNPLIHERLMLIRSEVVKSIIQLNEVADLEARNLSSISVNNHSTPKIRHLLIIAVVSFIGAIFFTVLWHQLSVELKMCAKQTSTKDS